LLSGTLLYYVADNESKLMIIYTLFWSTPSTQRTPPDQYCSVLRLKEILHKSSKRRFAMSGCPMGLVQKFRERTKDLGVDVIEHAEGATIEVDTQRISHMEVQNILGRLLLPPPPIPLYPDDKEKEFMCIAKELFKRGEDFSKDLFKKFVRERKLEAHFPDIEWS